MGNIKLISSRGKKGKPKPKQKHKQQKRRRGGRTALVIFIVLMVGIIALFLSLGFYVKNLDTVYPNVWAEGIKLSGLTLEEAKQALIDGGYESNAKGVFATIVFPDASMFTISGEEVGLSLNADEAAQTIYAFGRGVSFVDDEIAYIKAMLNKTELHDLSKAKMDDAFVRDVVREHTKKFNEALIDDKCEVNTQSIVLVKGTGIESADEGAVYNLTIETLLSAMEEKTHLTREYIPQKTEQDEIDLDFLYNTIKVDPVSSVYDPDTLSATASAYGISFDLLAAQALLARAREGESIEIPLVTLEPEVTEEEIESLLFRDLLATKKTNIGGTSNRLNNVVLSSQAINGTVLNPGDVFSYNGIVGQRTAARGYKEANAYVSGKVVLEVGGGICQTSSTIYDCVLHTSLEVLERSSHMFTVSYLPMGHDATINWGTIDFKFKNNTDYPIRVEVIVEGRDLTVNLWGTKLDDTYIKIETERVSTIPFQVIRREDESVAPGKTKTETAGHTGYVVDTYKLLYDANDNLISRTKVSRSSYRSQDSVILIPPASAEVPNEPTANQPGENPGTQTPENPDPQPTDPQPTDPQPTDPQPTDPQPTDPQPTDPQPTDPQPTEPVVEEPTEGSRQEPD